MNEIQEMIENNEILKEYLNMPNEELKLIRMYINLDLIWIESEKENQPEVTMLKSCDSKNNSYLTNILDFRCDINRGSVADKFVFKMGKNYSICQKCQLQNCIKNNLPLFMYAIDNYNEKNKKQFTYIEVLDFILKRNVPEFNSVPEQSFFDNVDIIDLMYIHVILEADLLNFTRYDDTNGEFEVEYLDLENLDKNNYLNGLLNYYKNSTGHKKIIINIKENSYLNEKDYNLSIYKLATYYKYLIEIEKVDIIKALRNLLLNKNTKDGITMRAYYAIHRYNREILDLPYSESVKDKITSILNYVLNYRYRDNIPYIPLNVAIYTEDKEIVEHIVELVSDFMCFFGYISSKVSYYNENIDDVILNKYSIKNIFYDNDVPKNGIILLDNFTNLLHIDDNERTLILNILANDIEKNNNRICTFIYGNKRELERIFGQHYKFMEKLINIELDIDDLSYEKVYELILSELEKDNKLSDDVKEKLRQYIKSTYNQSNSKNIDYAQKLYDYIVLSKTKKFNIQEEDKITLEDIPKKFNERDLPTILNDLNALTGLSNIKTQIKDFVSLLKFNKKAQVNIENFNLHMIFTGNPGTGKTTVARLITDILYNLGYISQNRLTEVTSKDLIAEYVGQTAGKTYNVVKSALGGVLFIDEAYSITMGQGTWTALYGSECIATLLKLMEDYNGKLIIIFGGYKEEMEKFIKTNPGLASRIGYKIDFPDYSLDELTNIFLKLVKRNNLEISDEALEKIKIIIRDSSKIKNFGNARYINSLYQKLLIEHAKNEEINNYKEDMYRIKEVDVQYEKLIADNLEKKIGF